MCCAIGKTLFWMRYVTGQGGERPYGELGHDGLQLGRGEDACVAQVFEFGADGAEGAVDLCCVGHLEIGIGIQIGIDLRWNCS